MVCLMQAKTSFIALGMIPGWSPSPVWKKQKVSVCLSIYGKRRTKLTKVKVFPDTVHDWASTAES